METQKREMILEKIKEVESKVNLKFKSRKY